MTTSFFDLRPTHNAHRWYLPVSNPISVGPEGRPFLFGGVGLAAAVSAMEQTCGRPAIWATAQYLSFARPPSIVDLDVWVPSVGNLTSQARVIGHVGDQEIITVNAALGVRPSDIADQWVDAPAVKPPEDCEIVGNWRIRDDNLHSRFEVRLAQGRYQGHDVQGRGSGRVVVWVRPKEGHPVDSAILCIIADFVSAAITDAIGELAGGNSLDNTIRFGRLVPTDWVLCDMAIESIQNGVVHGAIRLFARTGELMASASQSLVLRLHTRPGGQATPQKDAP